MANTYFLHQAKHNASKGTWDKGIVIKEDKPSAQENYADALQGYHAYLGAYAYGHDSNTDYVSCSICDRQGNRLNWEVWDGADVEPEEGGEEA